mmetsp:Transcript_13781/g.20554  ORF Transcript_13781/g.20554 Transcript_13781/m.20554 type:complete len:107 (+) Transcript_13781:230-550(+)
MTNRSKRVSVAAGSEPVMLPLILSRPPRRQGAPINAGCGVTAKRRFTQNHRENPNQLCLKVLSVFVEGRICASDVEPNTIRPHEELRIGHHSSLPNLRRSVAVHPS